MRIRDSIVLRWCWLFFSFLKYKIRFRKEVHFAGLTYIYVSKDSILEFRGKGIWINNYTVSNMFGLFQRTTFYAVNGGRISIGANCGISGASICSMNAIDIGERVLIGANTKILDNDMHSLSPNLRAADERTDIKSAPVIIGNDCFIGANSIILKGTVLGEKCIVGAGSVVHGVFPENSVIAGNPARLIRKNE